MTFPGPPGKHFRVWFDGVFRKGPGHGENRQNPGTRRRRNFVPPGEFGICLEPGFLRERSKSFQLVEENYQSAHREHAEELGQQQNAVMGNLGVFGSLEIVGSRLAYTLKPLLEVAGGKRCSFNIPQETRPEFCVLRVLFVQMNDGLQPLGELIIPGPEP